MKLEVQKYESLILRIYCFGNKKKHENESYERSGNEYSTKKEL